MSVNEFERDVLKSLGRIEEKVDSLSGPQGRVTKLEEQQQRQWWLSAAIIPVISGVHAIARKIGLNI